MRDGIKIEALSWRMTVLQLVRSDKVKINFHFAPRCQL